MARILIIEDNAANLGLMSYLLTAFGHTAEGCRDGRSGLEAARHQSFDLVLCDIQLPRMSGYEIARILRAAPSLGELPLVAVTALAMRGDREQVLGAGFNGYIEKPLQPQTFVALVETFLPPSLRKGSPANATHPPAVPPPEPLRQQGRQRTVLAVDDVPGNLSLMQAIFRSAGYRVLTAANMHQGLDLMRREKVDLVVSDVHMLSGDGFKFRRAAAAEPGLAGIPFIFVSSSNVTEEDRREAEQAGVYQLIERPVEPQSLINIAEACLAGSPGPP
jgi:two-component system cell cycle response regulator